MWFFNLTYIVFLSKTHCQELMAVQGELFQLGIGLCHEGNRQFVSDSLRFKMSREDKYYSLL
jgi:hypothetical protein